MSNASLIIPSLSQVQNSLFEPNVLRHNAIKILITWTIASLVTVSLFWLMSQVLKQSGGPPVEAGPVVVIDPVFNEREIITHVDKPLPPQPKVVEPPKIPSRELEPNESDNITGFGDTFEVATPNIDTSPNTSLTMTGGDARPIVRISPQYPVQAARDGIEGWVQLSFSINELGAVEDVVVVDAEPKRVFNRAAIKALRKWKYRPKTVDGQPVKQVNISVQLDFNIEGNDAR